MSVTEAELIAGEAYQIIGDLALATNLYDHPEVQRALDWFSGFEPGVTYKDDASILPWPKEELKPDPDLPRASGVPEAEAVRLRREAFMAGVAWQKEMEAPPVAAPSGEAELKVGKSLIRKAELLPPFDLARILALREAERFMAYFAGETDGTFAGPGTPKNCLAQIRQALAGLPASPIASEPKDAGSGEGQDIAEQAAQFLWSLLDDIDTLSDHVKADNVTYREIAERIQRRRFEVGDTDGYTVTFKRKAEIRTAPSGTKP